MTVRQYVDQNFTDIEKSLFDYILSSFPESVLVIEGSESEDILALLATLAKVFGNSKELILNLKTGHSIEETINKIENNYLAENNENLLLTQAADLKYHRLSDNIETSELVDRLLEEKPFVLDYYNLYKNRGTLTAITQILTKFAVFLGKDDLPFNIFESSTEMDLIIENVGRIETFGDFEQGDFNYEIGEETIEVVPIKKDSILYDMLMKIKPVGLTYNILLRYASNVILNLIDDRVVGKEGRISLLQPQVYANQTLLSTSLPKVESVTIEQATNGPDFWQATSDLSSPDETLIRTLSAGSTCPTEENNKQWLNVELSADSKQAGYKVKVSAVIDDGSGGLIVCTEHAFIATENLLPTGGYTATIKNISTAVSLEAYVTDWPIASILSSVNRFEDLLYRTTQLNTAVSYTQDAANRFNFIFDTEAAFNAYVAANEPDQGTQAIVTGFRWEVSTEAAWNSAPSSNRLVDSDIVSNGNAPDIFDMQNKRVPNLSLRNASAVGSIVSKYTRSVTSTNETLIRYFRLVTVTTGGYPNAIQTSANEPGVGFFRIIGFRGFSFERYVIPPNSTRAITRMSTAETFSGMNQFLGVYFTNIDKPTEKTPNLIVPFNNPEQINIVASPLTLPFEPSITPTIAKQLEALTPIPQAILTPSSIFKTSSSISGTLTNNNSEDIANIVTQIRLLNNSTSVYGPWQSLATSSVFRNDIPFSFTGLSANITYTFQTRNVTSTLDFEPTSEPNTYQETTPMAQQLSPPQFREQGLQIGDTTFTVSYTNPNNVAGTLTVFVDELQEFQQIAIQPFNQTGDTQEITFGTPEYQIEEGTEYTVSARLEAPGFTNSQFVSNTIETTGGVVTPVVTEAPTLSALQATGTDSISFTLTNNESVSVKFAWEVRTADLEATIVASQDFGDDGFIATSKNFTVDSGLTEETGYVVRAKALGDGNFSESAFTSFQNVTTQAEGLPQTTTPQTAVITQTSESVTFRITNADTSSVNVQYEIATEETGGDVLKSGSFIFLLDSASAGGTGTDRVDVTADAEDGIESQQTYHLRSVFAKADEKSISAEATRRSTTTPPKQVTATFATDGGTPATYTSVTVDEGDTIQSPGSPTKTGFEFSAWSPTLPRTINENTAFTSIWRLRAPTINNDPNNDPIIFAADGPGIGMQISNNNNANFNSVRTEIKIITEAGISLPNEEWQTVANFSNNQTLINYTLTQKSDGSPLLEETNYSFQLRNVPVQTGTAVLTSNTSTNGGTSGFEVVVLRIVKAILVVSGSTAVSGINIQYEITGPGDYSESGTKALNSTSYTSLETNVPDDSTAYLVIPTSFVFDNQTYSLDDVTTFNNVGTITLVSEGEYEISDINQNTSIDLSYIIIAGSGGGGTGGGAGDGGDLPGLEEAQ